MKRIVVRIARKDLTGFLKLLKQLKIRVGRIESRIDETAIEAEEDKESLVRLLADLYSKERRLKGVEHFSRERFWLFDPESLEKLIEKEVTDFDTMKAYLKKLSLLTLFLYKKLMEGELS